jgi:hypothetical protein
MRTHAKTETARLKNEVQKLVRAICIKRDKHCILSGVPLKNGGGCSQVLQAHHLVTRGKNIGYADTRLIVLICTAHHSAITWATGEEKRSYDALIKKKIGKARSTLLARAEADQQAHPMDSYAWGKEIIALKEELKSYK